MRYKDKTGEPIYWPKDAHSGYFDTAFRRSFKNIKEKAEFMNKHGIVEAGDLDCKIKKEKKEHYERKMDGEPIKQEKRKCPVKPVTKEQLTEILAKASSRPRERIQLSR